MATEVDFNQIDRAVHQWHLAYANKPLDSICEMAGRIYSTPHAKLASRTEEFLEAKTMLILLAVLETNADVDFAVVFLDSLDSLQDSDSFSSLLLPGLFRSDLEWSIIENDVVDGGGGAVSCLYTVQNYSVDERTKV